MDAKKFLQQVYNKINGKYDLDIKLSNDCIEVIESNKVIFIIQGNGSIFYSTYKRESNIVDKLSVEVTPIVLSVEEYLKAMESSPKLTAVDFDMPYKKLGKYNGVIFGGREYSNGSFEFATWDYRNNALYHGHYYTDYEKAKEDFVVRSNLIQSSRLFHDTEMIEIYRCIEDIFNVRDELSDVETKVLEKIQEKIRDAVPDFSTKLCEEIERECEQEEGQTM